MHKKIINYFQRTEEVHPYSRLSIVYDRLMNYVDYVSWASYIETLFEKYGKDIRNVVDGGCGTGTLIIALEEKGYHVAGFDRSIEMIRIALRKVQIPFWQGDLKTISLLKGWDAFLCLYDTLLYLTVDEIMKMFSDVKRILVEGGLLIFDTVTENHIKRYWANYSEQDRGNGWRSIRRSWYDRKMRYQHTEFEIFFKREGKIYKEHHYQKIYYLEELEQFAEGSGLKLIGRFNGFTHYPGSEKSDRVHFVFKKEAL